MSSMTQEILQTSSILSFCVKYANMPSFQTTLVFTTVLLWTLIISFTRLLSTTGNNANIFPLSLTPHNLLPLCKPHLSKFVIFFIPCIFYLIFYDIHFRNSILIPSITPSSSSSFYSRIISLFLQIIP